MRITFELSGGYGGLFAKEPLTCHVDLDALPPDESAELQALLAESGLLGLDSASQPRAGASVPDAFCYRLTLVDDGPRRSHAFDDRTVPPAARPLLERLRRRAIEERQRRT